MSLATARLLAPWQRVIALDRSGRSWAGARGNLTQAGYDFLRFGLKQAWACMFGALLLAPIIVTKIWFPPHATVARYDALFLAAPGIQTAMLLCRFETLAEARLIFVFHLLGKTMEIFKTSIGAWTYPEPSLLRVGGVPLFTGFMYAAVGSYLMRIWRSLDFRFSCHPSAAMLGAMAAAIYVNFFSHHFLPDIRVPLLAATAALFGRTTVYFRPWRTWRKMPLLPGFVLVACFIWLAENIATFTGIWRYPAQKTHWHIVPPEKLQDWLLLMIVSLALVSGSQRGRQ